MGCGVCEQTIVALVGGIVFMGNFILTGLFQILQAIFLKKKN